MLQVPLVYLIFNRYFHLKKLIRVQSFNIPSILDHLNFKFYFGISTPLKKNNIYYGSKYLTLTIELSYGTL
jgi:hypothetical protein